MSDTTRAVVLGVYASALHVRWQRPDGSTVAALAVDDEPTVFWDGADARQRIDRWHEAVNWRPRWGAIAAPGGNGSSGRHVSEHVLNPLDIDPAEVYFTDCLPWYLVKSGPRSQGRAISTVYKPFAARQDPQLPEADLPERPQPEHLVHRAVLDEAPRLRSQLAEADAPLVITLGQESADVLARLGGVEPERLAPDADYGRERSVELGGRELRWLALTHPGNHHGDWLVAHRLWARDAAVARL